MALESQVAGVITLKATGANSRISAAAADAVSIPAGTYITVVLPRHNLGSTSFRGEIYCVVTLLQRTALGTIPLQVLWRGQIDDISNEGTIPSTPNYFCGGSGYQVTAIAWFGSARSGADTVDVIIEVSPEQKGSTFYFNESPTEKPGFKRSIGTSDPAAGANYGAIVVPAAVIWKLRSFRAAVVFAAGNKSFVIQENLNTGEILGLSNVLPATAASGIIRMSEAGSGAGMLLETAVGNALVGTLVPKYLVPNDQVLMTLEGILAGDDLAVGNLVLEEWAGPL